jgi:hypothetical protein
MKWDINQENMQNGYTGWIGYRGPARLTMAAIGLQVAQLGTKMILQQSQTIFRYSGCLPGANRLNNQRLLKPKVPQRWRRLQHPMPGGAFPYRRTYPPSAAIYAAHGRCRPALLAR